MDIPFPGNKVLRLVTGDITRVAADAIVNAANSALAGGGGVDGAIHRAGGPSIMQELHGIRRQIGTCPAGSAVATGAGALPARWVFHAVGPIYRGGAHGEAEALASCYRTCLQMARERGAASISFPSISTGRLWVPRRRSRPDRPRCRYRLFAGNRSGSSGGNIRTIRPGDHEGVLKPIPKSGKLTFRPVRVVHSWVRSSWYT